MGLDRETEAREVFNEMYMQRSIDVSSIDVCVDVSPGCSIRQTFSQSGLVDLTKSLSHMARCEWPRQGQSFSH